MNDNNYRSKVFQGSLLVEEARPEKGFFIKSKKRYYLLRDDKWHTKFTWEPVVVGDLWADETDGWTSPSAASATTCLSATSWMFIVWT